jgi:hypothetical protein
MKEGFWQNVILHAVIPEFAGLGRRPVHNAGLKPSCTRDHRAVVNADFKCQTLYARSRLNSPKCDFWWPQSTHVGPNYHLKQRGGTEMVLTKTHQ